MAEVARGNGTETVASATGDGYLCGSPLTTTSDACSSNVFANGIGIVRLGDSVTAHPMSGCSSESPGLSIASETVFINGKGCGRKGDNYDGDGYNLIRTGSSNVFAGG